MPKPKTIPNRVAKIAKLPSPVLALGDPEDYGPAMRALTDHNKRFVVALVHHAGGYTTPDGWHRNAAEACRLAGIGGTESAVKTAAHRRMGNPAILAAIREEDDKFLSGDLPQNRRVMIAIRDNPKAKDADRLKAALALDSLGGRGQRHETHVTHELRDSRSTKDIQEELAEFYRANPDLVKLSPPKKEEAVEAEFEEVGEDVATLRQMEETQTEEAA